MRRKLIILLFLVGGLIGACSGQPVNLNSPPSLTPSGSIPGALQQRTATPTSSSTPSPIVLTSTATPTPGQLTREAAILAGRTATAAVEQTRLVQTNSAFDRTAVASNDLTSTAVVHELLSTVAPRTFQSMPSPDGKWLAEVILYDCAQIAPPDENSPNAYEILKVSSVTVETQFLSCGGLGAAGFSGLFWTPDSHYFYYTDAREGWPDGGYPWVRPVSRFDVTTGKSELMGYPAYSPDRQKIAGAVDRDLVIWDVSGGPDVRFSGLAPAWTAWSPDGRSLAVLTQVDSQLYPAPTNLTRVDLDTGAQTRLLNPNDPAMLTVEWNRPGALLLQGADFITSYTYDLANGRLSPLPRITPGSGPVKTPTPSLYTETPAPTYPPDPAFPADLYPPAKPFRQPVGRGGLYLMGHGCPDLSAVQAGTLPAVKTIVPVLKAARTGDVYQIRTASDTAYWPVTGLSLPRQNNTLIWNNISIQPAAQSPQAGVITRLCGSETLHAAWWAHVKGDDGNTDYFLVQRKDRWLVWLSVYDFGQFPQ